MWGEGIFQRILEKKRVKNEAGVKNQSLEGAMYYLEVRRWVSWQSTDLLCVILKASSTTLSSTSMQNTCILNISANVSIWLFAHSMKPVKREPGGTL